MKIYLIFITLLIMPITVLSRTDIGDSTKDSTTTEKSRLDQMREITKKFLDTTGPLTFYDFNDSLMSTILHPHRDYSDDVAASYYQDAGQFMKSNPSNFIIKYRQTPLRTSVAPFTLPGNRLNMIYNGRPLDPIDHHPEPDNMIDGNDIPTEAVQHIYNIEGPLGMIFGGGNAVSSMVLLPHLPDSFRAESRMVADVGFWGYAYTKAMFSQKSPDGRTIRAGVGYRKIGRDTQSNKDDAYHQWYETVLPYKKRFRVGLNIRLYRRTGFVPYHLVTLPDYMKRHRRDRELSGTVEWVYNSKHKGGLEIGRFVNEINHQGQLTAYDRNIDIARNYLTVKHEVRLGSFDAIFDLHARQETYEDRSVDNRRHRGYGSMTLLKGDSANSWLLYAKGDYVGGFDPLPSGMAAYNKYSEKFRFNMSVGYATKFPRQYELDLTPEFSTFFSEANETSYLEKGNPDLIPEKQLIGNIKIGLGSSGNDLSLSITGGKIFDGIDWQRYDTLSLPFTAIKPINHDLEFANITAIKYFSWRENVRWTGGGSYRYLKIAKEENPPYSPNYQLFNSLQLHYYIEYLNLHLYGYGEAFYNAVYHGYNNEEFGEKINLNIKLSFRIKKFRFYYIFDNPLMTEFYTQEDFKTSQRYNMYGITWDFLD